MIGSVSMDRWNVNQQLFRRVLESSASLPSEIVDRSPFHAAEKGQEISYDIGQVMNQSDVTQLEAWEKNRVDGTVESCWDIRPNLYQHTLTEASSGKTVLQVPPDEHLSRIRAMMAYWHKGFEALGRYFDFAA